MTSKESHTPENTYTTRNTNNNIENANTTDDQVITIFHDRVNYTVKHPLENTWTLWFDNPRKKATNQTWSTNLKEIISVDTIEDFWGVYNNILKVNQLYDNCNYHLFKKGIRPEWEDPMNAKGGKFSLQFLRNRSFEIINGYWLFTMLAMIGEQLNDDGQVCGGVVSVRRTYYRISLWITSSDNEEFIRNIGQEFKQLSNIPPNMKLEFTSHDGGNPNRLHVVVA